MNIKKTFILFLLLALLAQAGCQNSVWVTAPSEINVDLPSFITYLHQLNDYPFYELHYKGDYGFAEYLDSRLTEEEQSAAPARLPGFACSGFAAFGRPDTPLFGRNFDWDQNPALILFTNPSDGYASVSMVDISSLGYSQYLSPFDNPRLLRNAPYLPYDGMNEHGLAVSMMAIGHAEGGADPAKVMLDELQMIRLVLDYARDVDEALGLMDDYNVDFSSVPVHYFLADRGGRAVVVEYLDGEPVIVRMDGDWQVSTNFILSEEQPIGADSSCWRYNHLWRALEETGGTMDAVEGMRLLSEVSQENTRWSMIYNLADLNISVTINGDYDHVYEFVLMN